MNKVITLSGFRASGKDFMLKALTNSNREIKPIISVTSRKPRPNEIDGIDYYFKTEKEIRTLQSEGKLLDFVERGSDSNKILYGIEKSEISERDCVGISIVDDEGVQTLEKYCKENSIKLFSFFIDCSPGIRVKRGIERLGDFDSEEEDVRKLCKSILLDYNIISPKGKIVLKNENTTDFVKALFTIIDVVKGDTPPVKI